MDRRRLNSGKLGNKGGGRPTEKEGFWHRDKWNIDTTVEELEAKIRTGTYAVRDVYLLRALKADRVILKNLADKVLANLHDFRGADGKDLMAIPDEDKALISAALRYAGTRKTGGKNTE
jgi:hypothetical protein